MVAMKQIASEVAGEMPIQGLGVAVPGVVDMKAGVIRFIPNVVGEWDNRPLATELSTDFAAPCFLLNDARAATYGELHFGAGRGYSDFVLLTIGTGIGGGIVLNGDLYLGSTGNAGEVGHQIIDLHGPRCGCGGWGCGEALASASALAAAGMRAVTQGMSAAEPLQKACHGDLSQITARLILSLADQGDDMAKELIREEAFRLSAVIGNLIVVLNPQRVIVGGGVSLAGGLLLDEIRSALSQRIDRFLHFGPVEIVPAELGEYAGAFGAAAWGMRRCL